MGRGNHSASGDTGLISYILLRWDVLQTAQKGEMEMGVDIYMQWDGMTEQDEENQLTGFENAGEVGYLRGAYFGGFSDVLHFLFDWADWDASPVPFEAEKFEQRLRQLRMSGGERPGKGKWDYTKGEERGWDLSQRQNSPVDPDTLDQYEGFLQLGRRLASEGKNPQVHFSY